MYVSRDARSDKIRETEKEKRRRNMKMGKRGEEMEFVGLPI